MEVWSSAKFPKKNDPWDQKNLGLFQLYNWTIIIEGSNRKGAYQLLDVEKDILWSSLLV